MNQGAENNTQFPDHFISTEEIRLDRPRLMRLDLNALALIEKYTGANLLLNQDFWRQMGVADLVVTLWAAIKSGEVRDAAGNVVDVDGCSCDALSREAVGALVGPQSLAYVSDRLVTLWRKTLPSTGANDEGAGAAGAPAIPLAPVGSGATHGQSPE